MELILCAIFALVLAIFIASFAKKRQNLPNGPAGLPIVGNLHQFLNNPQLQLSQWAQRYGKIFTVNIGSQPVLVVNDVKTMKQIFGTLESTGMYQSGVVKIMFQGAWGILGSEGNVWQEQHRFIMHALKNLGFGNGSLLDPVIMNEIDGLCGFIDKKIKSGQIDSLKLNKVLMQTTTNTIWNIITGERIKAEESPIVHLLETWVDAINVATQRGLAFLPWLKYVAPGFSGYTNYAKASEDVRSLVRSYFDKCKKARQTRGQYALTDLISVYLNHVEKCEDPNSSFYGKDGEKHGFFSVISLMLGGSETTASVLTWLIFHVMMNPNVQRELQKEIDENIGTNRDPSLADRHRMPYIDAVVMETLRYCSLLPFGIIHKLIDDVKYDNFTLPKGMLLYPNIYFANHNPSIWEDPEVFHPERFLIENDAQRKTLRDCVATFQEGKRKCPGEQMAKDTIFLAAAKLFQKYEFNAQAGIDKEEYLKPRKGYFLLPQNLGVGVQPRAV